MGSPRFIVGYVTGGTTHTEIVQSMGDLCSAMNIWCQLAWNSAVLGNNGITGIGAVICDAHDDDDDEHIVRGAD